MNYGTCPERIGKANSKSVIQLDKEGNFVGKYISISCAEQMTKISQGSIGDCLHGRRKTAGNRTSLRRFAAQKTRSIRAAAPASRD